MHAHGPPEMVPLDTAVDYTRCQRRRPLTLALVASLYFCASVISWRRRRIT